MFIIDKQIKEMCEQRKLIAENYNSDNVGSVSYDLTVEYILSLIHILIYLWKGQKILFIFIRNNI